MPRMGLLVLSTALLALGCGAPFKDYDSYRLAVRQDRLDAITYYLEKAEITDASQFILGVIDCTITDSISGPILADLVPRDDFYQFMNRVVPAVYYSLTQNLYASRTSDIASLTDSIIVRKAMNGLEQLETCTPRLREEIRIDLQRGDYWFNISEEDLSLPVDSAYSQAAWRNVLRMLHRNGLIASKLTFGDFLNVSLETQTRLMGCELMYVGIVLNGVTDLDSYSQFVDALIGEWTASSYYYLSRTSVAAVSRSAPLSDFMDVFIQAAMNR